VPLMPGTSSADRLVRNRLTGNCWPRLVGRKAFVLKMSLAILVLAGALLADHRTVRAAELVMFEDPACAWCRRWHAEIGPSYALTAEGRKAPLRRFHIRDQAIAGLLLKQPITATPTFVLAEEGRELGRIVGYPGEEFFYGLLGSLLKGKPR
jgi:hypothetical protein